MKPIDGDDHKRKNSRIHAASLLSFVGIEETKKHKPHYEAKCVWQRKQRALNIFQQMRIQDGVWQKWKRMQDPIFLKTTDHSSDPKIPSGSATKPWWWRQMVWGDDKKGTRFDSAWRIHAFHAVRSSNSLLGNTLSWPLDSRFCLVGGGAVGVSLKCTSASSGNC